MAIKLTTEHLLRIQQHAQKTYPHECCGFLLGRAENGAKEVVSVAPVKNARDDAVRHNRYLITSDHYLQADKEARRRNLDVIGFYHSHPDAPALPSRFDTEHGWVWYSYLIAEVHGGTVGDITSWVLRDDRSRFDREELEQIELQHKPTRR